MTDSALPGRRAAWHMRSADGRTVACTLLPEGAETYLRFEVDGSVRRTEATSYRAALLRATQTLDDLVVLGFRICE